MSNRALLGISGGLVLFAGGFGSGHLPSQLYVSSRLGVAKAEPIARRVEEKQPVHVSVPPRPDTATRIDFGAMARQEAERAKIRNPSLFVRQIAAESGFNICAGSPAGAQGIAQIMPNTAQAWGVDPFDPRASLRAAAQHMRRYEVGLGSYALALAAYNAGPGAVQKYHGMPPYSETRAYVSKIMGNQDMPGLHNTVFTRVFASRLNSLERDVAQHGGHVSVFSGYRSYDVQVGLWRSALRKYGSVSAARVWVAPPGCSQHGRGLAADLSGSLGLAHTLASRHGLRFLPWEAWHVETVGARG